MSDFKKICKIAFAQMGNWISSLRIIAGILLGLAFVGRVSFNTLRYAEITGDTANALDPYILVSDNVFLYVFMGFFLVISDAPFISQNTLYSAHRVGRRIWASGMVLYIFLSALLYHSIMLIASVLLVAKDSFLSGKYWSEIVYSISTSPNLLKSDLSLSFGRMCGMDIMQISTPAGVVLSSFVLQVLYSASIGIVAFAINLNAKKYVGSAVAIGVHLLGYLINNGSIHIVNQFVSPYSQVPFSDHNFGRQPVLPTLNYSFLMLGILLAIFAVIAVWYAGKCDLQTASGDKKQ